MSDFDRVRESVSLKEYAEGNLEHLRGGLKCPACESGTGKHKTPAFSIKGEKWKCFSCNNGGDVFDLAAFVHNLRQDDKRGQLEAVANWANISLKVKEGDPRVSKARAADWNKTQSAEKKTQSEKQQNFTEGREREKEKIKAAQDLLHNLEPEGNAPLEYLRGRGFADDEISSIGFGCYKTSRADGNGWKNSKGEWVNGGRILIPWKGCGGYYHLDRAIADDVAERKYLKPKSGDVGEQPIGWKGDLDSDECFLVEGLLDAYAVEAMGYHAAPLAGTAYEQMLKSISSRGYSGTIILMLDGDESGKKAQKKAAELCSTLKLRYYEADFRALTGAKDTCEAMASDRGKAKDALETILQKARAEADKLAAEEQRKAYEALHLQEPSAIAEAIWNCEGYEEPVSTGFHSLDSVMNGGLRSGLVVLGAVSSAGKTTLVVQIADTIAASGKPVLFVTIEQSGRELVAKSLSRMMAQRGYKDVTLWEMGNRESRDRWPETKTAAFLDCLNEYYSKVAPRLSIMSADSQPTVENIRAAAQMTKDDEGVSPVIFIDYLQLLAPRDERMSDKQSADYNVSELRRIARNMKTPVITISSLNRASYSGNIEMDSFKESGGIEYGADLLIGLQPYHMEKRMNEGKGGKDAREKRAKDITKEHRAKSVRESELVILKNRNGHIPSEPLPLTFYAASSLFAEGV